MEFKNLICANCGGADFEELSDLEYRCHHCHGLLVRTTKPVPVPPAPTPIPVTEFKMPEIPGLAMAAAIIFGVIFIGVVVLILVKSGPRARTVSIPDTPAASRTPLPSPTPKPELKVEVTGKTNDRFGETFIKCAVTNLSEVVIIDPYVRLTLYKGDVKLDTVSGDSKLKYLRPGVTVPVLVPVGKHTGYTRAEITDYEVIRSMPNNESFFPEFNYIGTAMKVETGISSFNGQPYKEKFYEVTGVIQNDRYTRAKPVLFVIFYNAKGEIVGAETASPAEMNKGDKVSFDASAGETQLSGTPVRFEVLAVDTSGKGNCLANQTC
jgi:hypothetical protein